MDTDVTDQKSGKNNTPLISIDCSKAELQVEEVEKESEFNALLPPRKGGMSRKSDKLRRSVQWNDKNGNQLVEILEFQPSDVSDSDDEDSDSCICRIM